MSLASRAAAKLRGVISPGARVWLLPNLALGLFVVALFALLLLLARRETETRKHALALDVQSAEYALHARLASNEEFLQELARQIAGDAIDRSAFLARTSRYVAEHPELAQIAWIDADQVVRWVAPFETTAWNTGERLSTPEQAVAFQRAQRTGAPAYSLPEPPPDEAAVIEVHVPVVRDRVSRGTVLGLYAADRLLRLLEGSSAWTKYRIVLETDDRVVSANSKIGLQTDLAELVPLDPPGHGLRLRVSAYSSQSNLPRDMLVLLIAGLVALMVWSLWRLQLHVRRRLAAERERDNIFKLSLDLLCVVRLDGTIERANPAFERVLGTAPEALTGTALVDLVHPDDAAETRARLERLVRGEPSTSFENRCRGRDGYRWLAWSANPALDERRLYCAAHDITDRKRDEDAIRSESAFRKAMEESVITGLRAVDLEGRITFVNPAFCQIVGFSAEELLGTTPPFPYWPEEERAELDRITATWMGGHTPREGFEIRVRRKSGERFFGRMYVSALVGADGQQTGWMASLVDITEQKQARAELEASRRRFMAVLEGLDAAVHVADLGTGEILFANHAFRALHGQRVVGHRAEEVTGLQLEAYPLDPRELRPEELPRELLDVEVCSTRDGRWYHVHDRAIRWVDGRVVRMQSATDITDRKQAEEVTLRQQERVQQTSRLITMGEMASTLAHELNQPLAAIANYCTGCVNRLSGGEYRVEELRAALEKASSQAERAGKIVRRMREFVRKREPNRTPVAVADIVEEALGIAEIEARKAGVAIGVEIPPDLPPVYADRIMIEQVVLNLVKNGIEAMAETEPGRRRLVLSARAEDGRAVELAVADRGQGFSPEQAGRLFAPFYTTKPQGMGMGLNICRSIVEFHDGRLWARPNEGGGSVFAFTLPVERRA